MQQIIIDKKGNLIEVTDLDLAIAQVSSYIGHLNVNPSESERESLEDRQVYWADLYSKLKHLADKRDHHGKN